MAEAGSTAALQGYGGADQKGPAQDRWADATMAPSYSYIVGTGGLAPHPLCAHSTPAWTCQLQPIL